MIDTRKPSPEATKGEAPPEKPQEGRLHLANDASEPYSVMVSPEARSVFFYYGRLRDRVVLEPGGTRTVELPPGAYTVRWVGEKSRFTAPVVAGGTTRVIATQLETEDYAGLHVSILEGEHEADAGMLKVFREARRPEPVAQASPAFLVPAPFPAYGGCQPPPPSAVPGRRRHSTPFIGPWTLLGAGVGAVIGHQSDSRDKGAALGAVLGHLLDHAGDD